MSDLEVIHAIEKQIEEPLNVCELETVMNGNSRCHYVLDQQQQVIGLNLQNTKQTDLALLKKLKYLNCLNLSLNQISQLTVLKELEKLTQLNLQKNNITDLSPLKELVHLTQLNLQDNQITELRPLKGLKNINVLNLQANQIEDIKALAGLTDLVTLNLSSNHIKELTALKLLKQLISLNLSSNQITELQSLLELTELIELDLRFNQINELEPLKNLKQLTHLYLSSNKITEISALAELTSLTHLFLSSNQIINPTPLESLHQLIELDLRANQISQIKSFENSKRLNLLHLENNQISDISPLQHLTELIQLNLRNNQISNIEPLKNLKKLTQLYLSNNKIQLLPKWIIDFNLKIKWNSGGDGISVLANPLKYPPPEIIRQGNSAIKAYFDELEQQQQRPLNEAKICFVGDCGVGKTSLIKALSGANSAAEPVTTQGIAITDWQYQNITAHCWDFGGDEQVQANHPLFFSTHCLYVLVLDNRPQRNETRWLKKIEYLAGNVPVLLVLNKCEESQSYDVDRRQLIKCYGGLQQQHFFSVSCLQKLGLEDFKQGLIAALKQVMLIKKLWPESWIQTKNVLVKQLKQQHYLSWQQYENVCQQQGVKDRYDQEQLLSLLSDLGICVHFKRNNLTETAVLESSWITQSFYKIIFSAQLQQNKGLLFIKDLAVILHPRDNSDYCYSIDHYRDLINLMRQLELCCLQDKTTLLLPQLADTEELPCTFDKKNTLRFRIYYPYLDTAILSRLIVAFYEEIVDNQYWRYGVLLKNKQLECDALIKANYQESFIYIQVSGEKKRDYFVEIRKVLQTIESSLLHCPIT